MKSLERAKSFVASRSASGKCRPPRNDVKHKPSAVKRSNSVCGPHHQPLDLKTAHTEARAGTLIILFHRCCLLFAITLIYVDITNDQSEKVSRVRAQLKSMSLRIESIDKMLHSLQELSDRCQRERIKLPRMRNGSNCDHDAIMRLVVRGYPFSNHFHLSLSFHLTG